MKKTNLRFSLVLLIFGVVIFYSFTGLVKNKAYIFPKIAYFPPMPLSVTNEVTMGGVELGRYLFYDPILSLDSTLACANCHKQQHAFSDSPNKYSKGFKDQYQLRNTPPLFNLAWYPKLFWDGRAESLETQVFQPVKDHREMNLSWNEVVKRISRSRFYKTKIAGVYGRKKIDSCMIANLIAQFERTLISYNSKYDKVINNKAKFTMDELEGLELMNDMTKGNCLHCHTTDANGLGTTGKFSNNGLEETKTENDFKDPGLGGITKNSQDAGKFKIPSLRNLLFTSPYMHDGRFTTLEEVLDFYSEGVKPSPTLDSKMEFRHNQAARLTSHEKRKIILFLKTMSDSAFISDKEFSNPFHN